jgi:hypothetical protein
MKVKLGFPKKEPVVVVETEVTPQQVMTGLAKLGQFIKSKLPFQIEVDKDAGTHQD